MLRNIRRNFKNIELLLRNLTCVRAHDEVDLMRGAINLFEQPLQIDASAGTGGGDHDFHDA
jgi:hypothetical protein